MCGRFVSVSQRAFTHVQTALGLAVSAAEKWPKEARDVYPGAQASLIFGNDVVEGFFGITPGWARENSRPIYNVRSESAAQKFRRSFRKERCIAPAERVFHWRPVSGQKKKEMLRLQTEEPLLLAALSSVSFRDREQAAPHEPIHPFAVLTTEAEHQAADLHRMPVILSRQGALAWLDPTTNEKELLELCAPSLTKFHHQVTTLENELQGLTS